MLIPLEDWARLHFNPIPSRHILRNWAKSGQLHPPAIKVGRQWRVEDNAEFRPIYISPLCSGRVKEILQDVTTAKKKGVQRSTS